ncbi:hypothetical protein IFM89_031311 [Coptis chinensis]|uniref:Galectin domain-containing protein n=1 Tax=Coptis chinensis TaxID=261450 RepID=A0A835MGE0_9MAGN|nr:hypothetical protein IFM89_031311 [Coptis chinensis]
MKRWYGGVVVASLFALLVLRYGLMNDPIGEATLTTPFLNTTNPLEWVHDGTPETQISDNSSLVFSSDILVSSLFTRKNFSSEENRTLQTWNHLEHLIGHAKVLPNAIEAIKEAGVAWNSLVTSVEEQRHAPVNGSSRQKQCPYFLNKMNATEFGDGGYNLQIPCGLIQGSSVTIIGIPNGLLGNFRIDLTVDELDQCNPMVGRNDSRFLARIYSGSGGSLAAHEGSKPTRYFPFKQGYLAVTTLRVGAEGIQVTVDGKHTTSFSYRETLEPWLVSEVRISGDLKLISVLAGGLPTSEDLEHIVDLESLRAAPLLLHKPLDLFIGVFSTANNFKRRMALRRTWMQYSSVRSGAVAVRFFVGLHKNQVVNKELWNEAQTYGDTQLMPFVDYYGLITWKTVAICIFGTQVVSAKYVMKTDDDAFVRVDEVLLSLNRINVARGLLYGLINSDSRPHRNPDSKWYISSEEYPEETYPPWAHGPGYVVSRDIAKMVYEKYKHGILKMFKLEDVAMGIWIAEMKKSGLDVRYEKEEKIHNEGCKDGYIIAHYQGPREMLCLWQKLQEQKRAVCCGE